MAAHRGLHETVKYLVKDLKLDVDGVGASDATPLISAIDGIGSASTLHQKTEYKRVVELLIRRGANANYSKPDGFSPLHAATLRDSYDIAKLLLDHGANVNAVCQNGTVLHIAVENGISDALVKLFLDKGVDPNAVNISGFTPLHLAAMKESSTIASMLLQKKANVDALCDKGTALHLATESSGASTKFLEVLLDNGANPNIANLNGLSALHLAILKGASDVAKFLLAKGVDINAACDKGTSLHLAAEKGDLNMITWLLQLDADPEILDQSGMKAIELAAVKGFKDCVEMLFHRTSPMNGYADWSIDGIMHHAKNRNSA